MDKHSSDSRFNGWGVSCRRNLDLWNLYSSEFDAMERRGDFDFDISSGLGTTGSGSAGLEMINSESDRPDTRAVVPFMSIINHYYSCRTLVQ